MYSGVLTSLLIAPLQQDVLRIVDDLKKKNYNFLYTNAGYFKNIVFMTKLMAKYSPVSSSLQILTNEIQMKETLPELVRSLAFNSRTVLFGPFLLIMMYWKLLTEANEEDHRQTKNKNLKRYCHMGKELSSTYSIPEAWAIVSNDFQRKVNINGGNSIDKNNNSNGIATAILLSSNMLNLLHRLEANGIHPYWMHFFYRIQGTKRAHDLNRFKSKTETILEIPVEPLGFYRGNVSVIFSIYY